MAAAGTTLGHRGADIGFSAMPNDGALLNRAIGRRLATSRSPINSLARLYGMPGDTDSFDPQRPETRNGYNWQEPYSQEAQDLGMVVAITPYLAENELTTLVSPIIQVKSTSVTWQRLEAEPMLAQRVAPRGLARLFTEKSTGGAAALSRYLLNHLCSSELLALPFGDQYANRVYLQMGMALQDTMAVRVLTKMLEAGNIIARFEQERRNQMNRMTLRMVVEQEINSWDCFKDKSGKFLPFLAALIGQYGIRNGNIKFDTIITAYAVVNHSVLNNDRAEMSKGGAVDVARFRAGPIRTTRIADEWDIMCPRSSRPGIGVSDDYFVGTGVIGGVAGTPRPSVPYDTRSRSITRTDMWANMWVEIPFLAMVRNSGIFDKDGKLRSADDALRNDDVDTQFSDDDFKNLPFYEMNTDTFRRGKGKLANLSDDPNNKFNPKTPGEFMHAISVFGQMSTASLDRGALSVIYDNFKDLNRDRERTYAAAVRSAQRLCTQMNQAKVELLKGYLAVTNYNDGADFEANGGQYGTEQDAVDCLTYVIQDAVPFKPPTEAALNEFNSVSSTAALKLECTALQSAALPVGFQTAAGFRGVAHALAAGVFDSGPFASMRPVAQEIASILPVLEELASVMSDLLPGCVLLNPRLAPNTVRAPSPLDTLFKAVINPDVVPTFNTANRRLPLVVSYAQVQKWSPAVCGGSFFPARLNNHWLVSQNTNTPPTDARDLDKNNLAKHTQCSAVTLVGEKDLDEVHFMRVSYHAAVIRRLLPFFDEVGTDAERIPIIGDRGSKEVMQLRSVASSERLAIRMLNLWSTTLGDPLRRVFTACVLYTPCTFDAIERMETARIPAPVGALLVAHHKRYATVTVIVMQRGLDTMATLVMPGYSTMHYDGKQRVTYWSSSFNFEVVIWEAGHRKFVRIDNAFVMRHYSGDSSEFFYDPENVGNEFHRYDPTFESVSEHDARLSLISFLVGWNECQKIPTPFSITGHLHTSTFPYSLDGEADDVKKMQYSSAPIYCALYHFLSVSKDVLRRQTDFVPPNQVCMLEDVKHYNPVNGLHVLFEGNDHWRHNNDFLERCPPSIINQSVPSRG